MVNKMTALQTKQEELAKKLEEVSKLKAEIKELEKVEPVFSDTSGDLTHDKSHFPRLLEWQRARVRIIEKINIANEGNNGFAAQYDVNGDNCSFLIFLDHHNSEPVWCCYRTAQFAEPMLYIRTEEAAEELLKDPEFCEDLRTYFKGWL